MPFVTSKCLKNRIWNSVDIIDNNNPPPQKEWLDKNYASFDDIEIWEEIYFEPGNIGVYAAWSPNVEIYIITFNLFLDSSESIAVYSGPTAYLEVYNKLKEFDITLPLNTVWINPDNLLPS